MSKLAQKLLQRFSSYNYTTHKVKIEQEIEKLSLEDEINKVKNEKAHTLLHYAIEFGEVGFVKKLIEAGADVNAFNLIYKDADKKNHNPLMLAVLKGEVEIIEILIDNGADLYAISDTEKTCLEIAARSGKLHIIEILLKKGFDVTLNTEGENALQLAVSSNQIAVVDKLCEHIPNEKLDLNNLLFLTSDLNMIKALTKIAHSKGEKLDFNIFVNKETLLQRAVKKGNIDLVEYFLENNADPNLKNNHGNTPFHYVTKFIPKSNSRNFIKPEPQKLIQLVDDVKNIIKKLQAKGGEINATNKAGITPLYKAIKKGIPELIECFYELGADFTLGKPLKYSITTPLYIAAKTQNINIQKMILSKLVIGKSEKEQKEILDEQILLLNGKGVLNELLKLPVNTLLKIINNFLALNKELKKYKSEYLSRILILHFEELETIMFKQEVSALDAIFKHLFKSGYSFKSSVIKDNITKRIERELNNSSDTLNFSNFETSLRSAITAVSFENVSSSDIDLNELDPDYLKNILKNIREEKLKPFKDQEDLRIRTEVVNAKKLKEKEEREREKAFEEALRADNVGVNTENNTNIESSYRSKEDKERKDKKDHKFKRKSVKKSK
ncbi:MAG: ankyrin repeat domain-containing protein [Sphingobacteriia bacterium]|nr:ankyrin repeat domain-containing protein [Sphingobacteriia bacterium]